MLFSANMSLYTPLYVHAELLMPMDDKLGADDWAAFERHAAVVHNREPTPQDLLELSARVYKGARKLHAEADAQGMRCYHDELLHSDVRLVMLVPAWFPRAHVKFDFSRLSGTTVSVIFVLRGTMQVGVQQHSFTVRDH